MKKSTLTLACALSSFNLMAAPTIYGLINKELRYVDQEKEAAKGTFTGVRDVEGFESRLGVKGTHDLKNEMKADYLIELGLNSFRDNGAGERIRIRRAFGKINGNFGSVMIGQEWVPNTLRMLKLDPFTATGAQLLGLESGDVTGSDPGDFGMRARYFQDLISYATPVFSGTQFSATFDRSNQDLSRDNDNVTTNTSTYMVTHDRTVGAGELNLHATYAVLKVENSAAMVNDNDESFMTVGARYAVNGIAASFAYTLDDKGEQTVNGVDKKEKERKHMMAALSYDIMPALTLAANWGMTTFDENETVGTLTKGAKQSQIAVGGIYKFSDSVKTRLIYKTQEMKGDQGTVVGTKKSSKANSVITGLTIAF